MRILMLCAGLSGALLVGHDAFAKEICVGYGPQAPRDISNPIGENLRPFSPAPEAAALNLCNIHSHNPAEHKGPGFAIPAAAGAGQLCDTEGVEPDRLRPMEGAFHGAQPGDTVEFHWVYSSCDVAPGPGLGSCLRESCANPQLRVEAQVFLVVNDRAGLDINAFDYAGPPTSGAHQPRALPDGVPVVFAGSTTGPSFNDAVCSPFQVTWSVRPGCQQLDIASLHAWAEANIFEEDHAHGVRTLVTEPALLSPMR
ncbi:MAG: delta-class carbonic anhydrase [Paracoccaceae bacterium]